MRKLNIGVIDILGKTTSRHLLRRLRSLFIRPNNQSIMPQVVAVWCEELGHDVSMAYYNGPEIMAGGIPDDVDMVFINAFSQNALLAYALSNYYRSKGAVTVLGGPHARSFPDDTIKYFDYAVGFCDKDLLGDIVQDGAPHRPRGQFLSSPKQPTHLPGVRQRWKFMTPIMEKAPMVKAIPMIGSLGCPYVCSFCIDALVSYQPLEFEALKEDLRFVLKNKPPRSLVVWHDPNFGIRFDDYMGLIEETVPPGRLTFLAEMSLSLLKEENARRLARNGFKALLPGIESWYDMGGKSKLRSTKGLDKVKRVADQANMIMSYIPYMQGNLIFGLDADEGPEPFELTKRFVDLAPGVYPYFSLLTAFGRNAPDNLDYQREGRVLNIPFHFLNQFHGMNVRPKNYSWTAFYDHVCDAYAYAYSRAAITRRFRATRHRPTRYEQLFRGLASERKYKFGHHLKLRKHLNDPATRRYFDGETTTLPAFYVETIRRDLGPLWAWLPEGALYHNPNAYLDTLNETPVPVPAPMT
ncbi:MAG: B12-binding domain-containing radical SAM protein [Rhodothermales bacterium]